MKHYKNHLGILSGLTVMIMAVSFFGILGTSSQSAKVTDELASGNGSEVEAPLTEDNKEDQEVVVPEEEKIPETINGLLIGFDKTGGLTDVIMVGRINPKDNSVKIISIPRDLEVYFTDEAFKAIKTNNPNNQVLHCKMNEIYSNVGWDDRALEDVKLVAEVITGLKMDYMMTIDTSGFSDMVDIMGGVEFDVPQKMHYSDPNQDLYIDLEKGLQVLDGDKAEQLVRYRKGYARGDLQRIEVQQDFLAALVDQVTSTRDFSKIKNLASKGYELVNTDFGLLVMLEYAEFFFDLDLEHILSTENMITIPSYGEKVEGHWFQYFDLEEAQQAVDTLINASDEIAVEE